MIEVKPINVGEPMYLIHVFSVKAADTKTGKVPNKEDLKELISNTNMETILEAIAEDIVIAIIPSKITVSSKSRTKIVYKILEFIYNAEDIYKFARIKTCTLCCKYKPSIETKAEYKECLDCTNYSLCWSDINAKEN